METIQLSEVVVVSDPCYSLPTWCQKVLNNVVSGEYEVNVTKEDVDGWGNRCSLLTAINTDYIDKNIEWEFESMDIGVDSGQCGIFSFESYRNDDWKIEGGDGDISFFGESLDGEGDKWYGKMCSYTLGKKRWGTYDKGVVSSSGIGDGVYTLMTKRNKDGRIVGIKVDFLG